MEINNFSLIRDLLSFGENTYYFLQIIQRRKDPGNEGMKAGTAGRYKNFITRIETFDKMEDEIKFLCKYYNARAYIEVNPRSFESFSVLLAHKLFDRIYNRSFDNIHTVQNHVALDEGTIKTKGVIPCRRWMFDIDHKEDLEAVLGYAEANHIKVVKQIPTVSGYHLLIEAFNHKGLGIGLDKDFKIPGTEVTTCMKPAGNTLLYCNL